MTSKKKNPNLTDSVPITLIEDPFGFNTEDITIAQNSNEPLELDNDLLPEMMIEDGIAAAAVTSEATEQEVAAVAEAIETEVTSIDEVLATPVMEPTPLVSEVVVETTIISETPIIETPMSAAVDEFAAAWSVTEATTEAVAIEVPAAELEAATAASLEVATPTIETPLVAEAAVETPITEETFQAALHEMLPEAPLEAIAETEVAVTDAEGQLIETADLEFTAVEPTAEDTEQLARLAQIMETVTQEALQANAQVQLDAVTEDNAEDEATRLAAEIAEDQALGEEMALAAEAEIENDLELQEALPDAPQVNTSGELDLTEMESCVEALLFMTDKPLSSEKLRNLLGPEFSPAVFQEAITSLCDRYKGNQYGIEVVEIDGGFQFRTKLHRAALAKKLAKVSVQRLSGGAMQSLAIIAYKQPVMKEEIDKIRGVDSSYFVRGLLDRKLIQISGRSDLPGRPMLYTTTHEFLELFGLKDLSAMPSLHEIEQMIPHSESVNPEDDDPRVREMRKLVGEMKADNSTSLVYNPREDEKILKEIREKVSAIPTSTPFLDQQKAEEKAAAEQAKLEALGIQATKVQPDLIVENAAPKILKVTPIAEEPAWAQSLEAETSIPETQSGENALFLAEDVSPEISSNDEVSKNS